MIQFTKFYSFCMSKICNCNQKEILEQVSSFAFREIIQSTNSTEHLWKLSINVFKITHKN